MVITIGSTTALSRDRKPKKEYSEAELRVKYERLNITMERAKKLKQRGYMPKAIDESKESVKIAEKEFGETSFIVIRPLLALAEVQGKRRHYAEAEQTFEKIYVIIASGDETTIVYGIAYRLRIARLYLKWNQFERAEITLLEAQRIIDTSKTYFGHYNRSIDVELKKVEGLKEANRYNIKKK